MKLSTCRILGQVSKLQCSLGLYSCWVLDVSALYIYIVGRNEMEPGGSLFGDGNQGYWMMLKEALKSHRSEHAASLGIGEKSFAIWTNTKLLSDASTLGIYFFGRQVMKVAVIFWELNNLSDG